MSRDSLSLSEARRVALAAQGFDRPRPRRVDVRQLRRTLRLLGFLQVDPVNVLVPAQYQPLFSRLGPYERSRLDELIYQRREFAEHQAHEASIVPVESWPLLHQRAPAREPSPRLAGLVRSHGAYFDQVLEHVRERGPLRAEDLPQGDDVKSPRSWRGWTLAREALEWQFRSGALAVAERRGRARVFDLAERVLPPEHLRDVAPDEAQRELVRLAAHACGVATAVDLAHYYRVPISAARERIDELADAGELHAVQVEGWREPAYLCSGAPVPRRVEAAALLSPFDPVVWHRPRAARLFGFDYRIEIYVPQPKRRWGYYVLPFLRGERLVARVDLKADRAERRLLAQAAYVEPHARPAAVASALASELRTLADWLELDSVAVGRRGDLARELGRSLGAGSGRRGRRKT